MSVPQVPVWPCITDERDTNMHRQLPEFSGIVSAIQRGVLINPKLLLYFLGLAVESLSVGHSTENEKIFKQIWFFIRDDFPTIVLKKMPHGSYGSVGLLHTGKPLISLSRDLVWAFENATFDNRAQLCVVVTTALLRELSHTIHPFISGSLQPETGGPGKRIFEDRVLGCFLGLSFDQDAKDISSLKGIFLTNDDNCHVPDELACTIWFSALITGRDPAWKLDTIPIEGAPKLELEEYRCIRSWDDGVDDTFTSPPASPFPPPPPPTPARYFPDCCHPFWEPSPFPPDFAPVASSSSPPFVPPSPTTQSTNTFSVSEEQLNILFDAWTKGDERSGREILTERPIGEKGFDANYIQPMYLECLNLSLMQRFHDKTMCEPTLPILLQQSLSGSPVMADSRYSASSDHNSWCYREVDDEEGDSD